MEEKKMLPEKSAADILSFDDRPYFQVDVPQWGCSIWCRELDLVQACFVRNSCKDPNGDIKQDDFGVRILLEGCFTKNKDGSFSKMFGVGDYDKLKGKGAAIKIIANAISDGKKNEPLKS